MRANSGLLFILQRVMMVVKMKREIIHKER